MRVLLLVAALGGCSKILGIDDLHGPGSGSADARAIDGARLDAAVPDGMVAMTIKISGRVTIIQGQNTGPGSNVRLDLLGVADNVLRGQATSDATGSYTITASTNGMPLDVYVHASLGSNDPQDTYAYFPRRLTSDTMFDVLMASQNGIMTLANACGVPVIGFTSQIALVTAMHPDGVGVANLVLTVPQQTISVCYFNGQIPSGTQTETSASGEALLFGLQPGLQVSLQAQTSGQIVGMAQIPTVSNPASYTFPVVVP